jgi:hypothetical protein
MTPYVTVALTSLVAYLFAVKRLGLRPADLARALARIADSVGTGLIFTLVNLVAAAALVLGLRALTGRFFSLYTLDDVVWLVVSLLQGWVWRLWRDSPPARSPAS